MALPVITSSESYSTTTSLSYVSSVVNLDAALDLKKMIQQNLEMKAIVEHLYGFLIPGFKSNVAAIVPKIDYLLSALATIRLALIVDSNRDLTELGLETLLDEPDRLKLVPDDLDHSGLLKATVNLIRRQHDRISDCRRSIEWRRRVCNFSIMTVVVVMLAVSAGLAFFREGLAAFFTTELAIAIKAAETFVNVMLNEEDRKLKEEEEVVEMMRYGEWLMVHEFNVVRQQAKTLKEEIMAEHSKLMGHIIHHQRMEKPKMVIEKTIIKMECSLKELERIMNNYGNNMQQFNLKFIMMVKK